MQQLDLHCLRLRLQPLMVEQRDVVEALLAELSDPDSQPLRLAELLDVLSEIEARRSPIARALREQASDERKREEERSVRQYVLRALGYVGFPQPAAFVQEFVWAHDRVELATRGFSALRRDEARAWRKNPGRRAAYVVPTLDIQGRALVRWMARSDWSLPHRIAVDEADELFAAKRVESLLRARGEMEADKQVDPYGQLLTRYIGEQFKAKDDLPMSPDPRTLRSRETASLDHDLQDLQRRVEARQIQAAAKLGDLTNEQKMWGR